MSACRSRCSLGLEASAAEDGTTLRGAEGNGGFLATLRADGGGFHFSDGVPCGSITVEARTAFGSAPGLAVLAALRFVLEFLVVVELLFTGREDKLGGTFHAFQYPVLKIRHGTILKRERAKKVPPTSPC